MIIKIFTNDLPGGWSPEDLKNNLGGSEEVVTMLATELAKNHEVIVYHSQKEKKEIPYCGVLFRDRNEANINNDETLITFKDYSPWLNGAKGKINIHWSSDIEPLWDTSNLDYFVNLTRYHQARNLWVPSNKSKVIPHGIDIKSLEKNKTKKEPNTLLYCSSPDRGLERLLNDWERIKYAFPEMKLKVAYGFDLLLSCSNNHPDAIKYKDRLIELCNKKDIEYLGALSKDDLEKEYWKSSFWVLPLERSDSELFCLNAIKSAYCGALPIVNKIGALQNTVGEHIKYMDFIMGRLETSDKTSMAVKPSIWTDIVKQYWDKLLQGEG